MKTVDILNKFAQSGKITDDEFIECMNEANSLFNIEPKSCEGCIHHKAYNGNFALSCCECSRFYSDNFEEMRKES